MESESEEETIWTGRRVNTRHPSFNTNNRLESITRSLEHRLRRDSTYHNPALPTGADEKPVIRIWLWDATRASHVEYRE